MSSAGRRTSFSPGRNSSTGRVRAAVMTATACSRVSDFDAPAFLAFGGIGQGGDVAADQVAGFGVPDGALERQVPHAHRRAGVPGGHLGQRLPHVGRGQLAQFAGADDRQDRLQDVLVLGDRFR